MKRIAMYGFVLLVVMTAGGTAQARTDTPVGTDTKATPADWAEFFEAVGDLGVTMVRADAAIARFDEGSIAWRFDECRFQSLQHALWTDREERLTAKCAVSKWAVPGGLSELLAVGSCESGWNRLAYNPNGHAGLFQHDLGAYIGRVRTYDPPAWDQPLSTKWTNSRGQVVMTTRMVHAIGGWSPWTCA